MTQSEIQAQSVVFTLTEFFGDMDPDTMRLVADYLNHAADNVEGHEWRGPKPIGEVSVDVNLNTEELDELEAAVEREYEVAYQMILAERAKRDTLEAELYAEYNAKLREMKEYMIDKVEDFLTLKFPQGSNSNPDQYELDAARDEADTLLASLGETPQRTGNFWLDRS